MAINILSYKTTRREFIKTPATLGALAALGDLCGGAVNKLIASDAPEEITKEGRIPFFCNQCGMGPDPAMAHIVNGVVVKVEGNPSRQPNPEAAKAL